MGTKREAHGTMSVEKQEEKKEKKRMAFFPSFFVDANFNCRHFLFVPGIRSLWTTKQLHGELYPSFRSPCPNEA